MKIRTAVLIALVGLIVGLAYAQTPTRGGTLNWSLETDVTFNTVIGTDRPSAFAGKLVFDTLTRVDEALRPVGMLAREWSVSDDGMVWTFHLHTDIKWHDGVDFTAEDVVFTFEHFLNPEVAYRYRGNFSTVTEVRAVDADTVQFVTSAPFAPLPAMLAYYAGIMPKHLLEGVFLTNEDFNLRSPVGTGAFKVSEIRRGASITLVANEDYYLGRPNIDRINIRILGDPDTLVAQLISGEIDLGEFAPGRHQTIIASQPHLNVVRAPTTNYNHAMINHRDPKYQDPRVVQALSLAVDRQAIIDSVMLGNASLPVAVIPDSIAWAFADELPRLDYDPERAAELMVEAGYTRGSEFWERDGVVFGFTMSADNTDTARRETAIIAQQYWRDFGADAQLEVLEWNVWLADRFRAMPDMTIGYWSTPTDPHHASYWQCEGSINYSKYCNEEVDRLFAAGVSEFDPDARAAIYRELQAVMQADLPLIPFYYIDETVAVNRRINGYPSLQMREALAWAGTWWLSGN